MNMNSSPSLSGLQAQNINAGLESGAFLHQVLIAIRVSMMMLILCGVLYTGVVTGLGQLLFPFQAAGSMIQQNGQNIGSIHIGQEFVSDRYFHGRPSAAGYDPIATGGSNLAPSNPELRARVAADSTAIQTLEGVKAEQIPVDMLAASGAGLDPHISPASAYLQSPRIARIRNLDEAQVNALIAEHTDMPQWGMLGQPRVNVLMLNLALDAAQLK
ncbi:potassium-transporting ATPase subunit KdpC [Photobacterium halotolerans]|uniref:potassium-transporting ATPase subunit KdpC n=1 Tax=Photobacterium halotolerans TaxID=265726 RepID=UPI001929CDCE|nr:potassium-transporting ATPase subunit KdpC [Photobacterium halotolerans]